ncbi:MAG: M15 family metallopeptidase [Flavobacteriales bacterium]|nr:M15 family metallopeptidase [Flavobacteriales bacterium]
MPAINSLPEGFVYVDEVIQDIRTDLGYFSSDNFIGDTVDGYLTNRAILSEQATQALKEVQASLREKGLGLKIRDAYRPQQAVDHFVRWGKDLSDTLMKSTYYPHIKKQSVFLKGYVSEHSGHSRGSTVDLTLVYLSGDSVDTEVDMGSIWDFFGPESGTKASHLTSLQKTNRQFLREKMMAHGFIAYDGEWWHFVLKDEPFPETFFNFPVK